MFNFDNQRNDKVLLNEQTGAVASITNTENGNNNSDKQHGSTNNNDRNNSGK
ncbi:hypothetical protein [Pseudarthrobacter sp. H2]|uniref:hypothetical protein n=1 Tax=Pseudarthrobacter sp. H2 TaxID=3418415 RepID=UPI003CF43654